MRWKFCHIFLMDSISHFLKKLLYALFFFSPFTSLIHLHLPVQPSLTYNSWRKTESRLELISSSSDQKIDIYSPHAHSNYLFSDIKIHTVSLNILKDHPPTYKLDHTPYHLLGILMSRPSPSCILPRVLLSISLTRKKIFCYFFCNACSIYSFVLP